MGRSEKSLSREGSDLPVHAVTQVPSENTWAPEAEKKLVRKIDLILIPMLWIISFLSLMDRAKFVPSLAPPPPPQCFPPPLFSKHPHN